MTYGFNNDFPAAPMTEAEKEATKLSRFKGRKLRVKNIMTAYEALDGSAEKLRDLERCEHLGRVMGLRVNLSEGDSFGDVEYFDGK